MLNLSMSAPPAQSLIPVEYDTHRKIRTRNKLHYRFNHWPIWIAVFFLAPGPLTFDLFEHGFDSRMGWWLLVVLVGTGIAGLRGQLPGCEPAPYIIRFTEDKPNPLYRRICYTFAWSAVLTYALLNLTALTVALATGHWYMRQIYNYAYFPMAALVLVLGFAGRLPEFCGRPEAKATSAVIFTARSGRSAWRNRRSGCSGWLCRKIKRRH